MDAFGEPEPALGAAGRQGALRERRSRRGDRGMAIGFAGACAALAEVIFGLGVICVAAFVAGWLLGTLVRAVACPAARWVPAAAGAFGVVVVVFALFVLVAAMEAHGRQR